METILSILLWSALQCPAHIPIAIPEQVAYDGYDAKWDCEWYDGVCTRWTTVWSAEKASDDCMAGECFFRPIR